MGCGASTARYNTTKVAVSVGSMKELELGHPLPDAPHKEHEISNTSPVPPVTNIDTNAKASSDAAEPKKTTSNSTGVSTGTANTPTNHNKFGEKTEHHSHDKSIMKLYPCIVINSPFYCLDEFISKYTKKKTYKWRDSLVVDINAVTRSVKIHFVGWKDSNDIYIDINEHTSRLAIRHNFLTHNQIQSGEKLSTEQLAIMQQYFKRTQDEFTWNGMLHMNTTAASTVHNTQTGNLNPSPLDNHMPPNPSSHELLQLFKVDAFVDVQDEYKSKKTQSMTSKWRKAIIKEITYIQAPLAVGVPENANGSEDQVLVRIHYVGWEDKWDEVLDVMKPTDRKRISLGNTYSELQDAKTKTKSGQGFEPNLKYERERLASNISSSTHKGLQRSALSNSHHAMKATRLRRKTSENELTSLTRNTNKKRTGATHVLNADSQPAETDIYWNPDYYDHSSNPDNRLLSTVDSSIVDYRGRTSTNLNEINNTPKGKGEDVKGHNNSGSRRRTRSGLPTSPYRYHSKQFSNPASQSSLLSTSTNDEEGTPIDSQGYTDPNTNTEMEYNPKPNTSTVIRHTRQSFPGPGRTGSTEQSFEERMEAHGLHVVEMVGDGNCLFRAVSHQMYLNEDRHVELRALCCDFMIRHRDRYESFCSTNFDEYIKHLRKDGTWGDHLEIKALEEIFDRLIIIYNSDSKLITPMNLININEKKKLEQVAMRTNTPIHPILISYHGRVHYNSVFNEKWTLPLPLREDSHILTTMRNASHEF